MKTATHQKKLRSALRAEIRHLTRCMQHLSRVDEETFARGKDVFATDAALAQWLCEPARSLQGAIPLATMRTAKGRRAVAEALIRIAHGIPT